MKARVTVLLTSLLLTLSVHAGEADQVKQKLMQQIPELKDAQVSATPVTGLYQVQHGAFVFYASADGRHVLRGQLLDIGSKRNLTDEAVMKFRESEFGKLADKDTMIYLPQSGKFSHTITVFTDVDCPYCQKLHAQLPSLLAAGIRVRYVFFPRSGPNTPSYAKAVHAWCNQQQPGELEQLMKGATPAQLKSCDNPIQRHFDLAGSLGLAGTPSILLADGTLIPGLVPAEELIKLVKGG